MSDSYFIGTVSRVHKIPRFSSPEALTRALKALKNPSDVDSEALKRYFEELAEEEAAEIRASTLNGTLTKNAPHGASKGPYVRRKGERFVR